MSDKVQNIIIKLLIFSIPVIAVYYTIRNLPKERVVLDDVSLRELAETSKGSNMAIMIGDKDGNYSTYTETGFPNNKLYRFNNEKSGCVDARGNTVTNALSYNDVLSKVSLRTTQSVSCYLYFDFIPEPTVTVTLNEEDALNVTATILSDKDGTYCINKSSDSNTPCLASGSVLANESVTTDRFAVSGTYYVHVEDEVEQVGHSSAIDVNLIYNQIEYIEATGTQYITTDYYPTMNTVVNLKFNMSAPTGGSIFGYYSSESDSFRFFNYSNNAYLDYGSGAGYNRINGGAINSGTTYNIEFGNRYVKNIDTNETIISNSSITFSDKTTKANIFDGSSSGKMYYVKIYDADVLKGDFYPVVRISDNKVGMYEKVNKKFYTNVGTGEFVAGNVIETGGIGPFILETVVNNNYSSAASLTITTNETGTYCVNTSNEETNMDNCVFSGNITANKAVTTGSFSVSNAYYVHIKNNSGKTYVGEKNNVVVEDTFGTYLKNNVFSNATAYSGLYRYTGSTANNYVDLGGVLYRVIGVTDGSTTNTNLGLTANQVKVIKAATIGDYQWFTDNSTDVRWNVSGYTVSPLYTELQGNTVLGNSSIIPSAWTRKISSVKWYVGDVNSYTYGDDILQNATTIFGYEDNATTQSTAKVGLMYMSDYYYAYQEGGNTNCSSLACKSWIYLTNDFEWTMTRRGQRNYNGNNYYDAWGVVSDGFFTGWSLVATETVRPVFYLAANVIYTGEGNGSSGSPYVLSYLPTVNATINNNNTANASLTISSDKDGTYCVNTSSTKTNMENCTFSGSLSANTPVTTTAFTTSGTYYVHVKDSAGNMVISSAQKVVSGTKFGEYLLQNALSGKTAYSGLYRYTGTSANNYVNIGGVLYRIIGVTNGSTINTSLGLTANQVKLIKASTIGNKVWHNVHTEDARWNVSGYTVADLYTELQSDTVLGNTSVIPSAWTSKISSMNWYVGDVTVAVVESSVSNASTVFGDEDNTKTQSKAKLGLMYLSDYYYAYNDGGTTNCYSSVCKSWMTLGSAEWTMSRTNLSGIYAVWGVDSNGSFSYPNLRNTIAVRPVFFLNADVVYTGQGDGTYSSPYQIQ